MRDLVKAFSVVAVSAIIGYEIGIRQWEAQELRTVVSKVVSLGTELSDIRRWAVEAGQNLTQEEFAKQLKEKLDIAELMRKQI